MDSVTHTEVSRVDMTNIPEELVFGLDIGTRSIVGTVGYKSSTNGFVVVAQASVAHETRSMLDGQIHDIGKVAGTIRTVCDRLEHITGREFKEVCIAAAGRVLKTVEAEADMHFNTDNVVTGEQIYSLDMLGVEKAYDILRTEMQAEDVKFYCVGYSVKQYYQNSYPISNLEGHKCSNIKVELIATFLPDEVVDGLYAAVERAGLYVANLTLEPIAAINVAIPERFRLLNLALVDVGAGTSDISITRDGSIVAYGMIPFAGDEVTEAVARYYLTDFTEADRMKCASTTEDEVTYHDIMGLPQKIPSQELITAVEETVRGITKNVSDKIIELNGGKPVSAVFVVGGGGKIGGFVETIAEYQGIRPDRVALRGAEVLTNVKFLQEDITVDSLLVTPIGICLNYYEQKNNFIFVTVNGERTKLYDNSKLTIMDAAMQVGFPNEDLFPKRGNTITYYLSGEKRMLRGEPGEAAVVRINGRETGINSPIESNDRIEITPSTRGRDAELTVGKIPELKSNLVFYFNGKKIVCGRFVSVNEKLVSEFYDVKNEDRIELLEYYTLKQVLEFMDIIEYKHVTVNNIPAGLETRVYDNFTVLCDMKEQGPYDFAQVDPTGMSVTGLDADGREKNFAGEGQDNAQAESEISAAEENAALQKTENQPSTLNEAATMETGEKAGEAENQQSVPDKAVTMEAGEKTDEAENQPSTPNEAVTMETGEKAVGAENQPFTLNEVVTMETGEKAVGAENQPSTPNKAVTMETGEKAGEAENQPSAPNEVAAMETGERVGGVENQTFAPNEAAAMEAEKRSVAAENAPSAPNEATTVEAGQEDGAAQNQLSASDEVTATAAKERDSVAENNEPFAPEETTAVEPEEKDAAAEDEPSTSEEAAAMETEEDAAESQSMAAQQESLSYTAKGAASDWSSSTANGQASSDVFIMVNGEPVILKNKKSYILVDVLDFYPVDTSVAHGDHLETKVNGIDCDFTKAIQPNDQVTIQWVG